MDPLVFIAVLAAAACHAGWNTLLKFRLEPVTATGLVAAASGLVAVPAVVVFGFCMSVCGIAVQTLIQLASDRSMRGRVMGLYGLIFRGAPAVGALAAGLASAHFGLRLPVFFGALLVIAVGLWTYLSRDRISAALETKEPESDV